MNQIIELLYLFTEFLSSDNDSVSSKKLEEEIIKVAAKIRSMIDHPILSSEQEHLKKALDNIAKQIS